MGESFNVCTCFIEAITGGGGGGEGKGEHVTRVPVTVYTCDWCPDQGCGSLE